MKKLVLFLLCSLLCFASSKEIESLQYWKDKFANSELKFGYYEESRDIIKVNKRAKSLDVYAYNNGVLSHTFTQNVIAGKDGDKMVIGDLKTPIGAYDIKSRFLPPDRYYGPIAFELTYPNLLDKLAKKTGSGIWIHGFPIDGKRTDDFSTRGCVALENDLLLSFSKVVGFNAVVLIDEEINTSATNDEVAAVMALIQGWKRAWKNSDTDDYLNFYAKDFMRYDGMRFGEFAENKRRIFARKEEKTIEFKQISIIPYPNVKNLKLFRVTFDENYKSPSHKFIGEKELYIRFDDNEPKIIVER